MRNPLYNARAALAALFSASFTGGDITPAMRGKRLVSVLPRANQSAERLAAAQAKRERKGKRRNSERGWADLFNPTLTAKQILQRTE